MCVTLTPVLGVKLSGITHITCAFNLYSFQVSPPFYSLVSNPPPSHDANSTELFVDSLQLFEGVKGVHRQRTVLNDPLLILKLVIILLGFVATG